MQPVPLGSQGLTVSRQGLGCMGMSEFYGPPTTRSRSPRSTRALELGVTCSTPPTCTARHTNEELVGRAIAGRRDEVVLATKFGIVRDAERPRRASASAATPAYVRQACEASLRRLGVDHIDLYYQHRVDPATPIEETVGAMAELVAEGKVRYLGLSEAAPETIRRAHAVHPITALQTEYSLWAREPEEEILPTLRELGIGFVPYSPLGRGFLTGHACARSTSSPTTTSAATSRASRARTWRRTSRSSSDRRARRRARRHARQVALAWVHARARTSSRSPAPSGAATWRRTSPRSTSS